MGIQPTQAVKSPVHVDAASLYASLLELAAGATRFNDMLAGSRVGELTHASSLDVCGQMLSSAMWFIEQSDGLTAAESLPNYVRHALAEAERVATTLLQDFGVAQPIDEMSQMVLEPIR